MFNNDATQYQQQDSNPNSARNVNFDQSLSSHSKLIKVPNQFANKLQEKAMNFEQQRLMN